MDGDSALSGAKLEQVEARDGALFRTDKAGAGESYVSLLRRAGKDYLEVEAS